MIRAVLTAQGAYNFLTGLWPIVSPGTFQLVTGRKREVWLVQTFGGLIAVLGAVQLATLRSMPSGQTAAMSIGSAAVLALADVIFVLRRRISPIYLADAAVETALIVGWVVSLTRFDRGALHQSQADSFQAASTSVR
jgi:hypothetical protein